MRIPEVGVNVNGSCNPSWYEGDKSHSSFAFSGQPNEPLTTVTAAARVRSALAERGLTRYVLHGGDFGTVIADELASSHPEEVAGHHLTVIPFSNS